MPVTADTKATPTLQTLPGDDLRQIMAQLGIRRFLDLIGRVDLLDTRKAINHWKASGLVPLTSAVKVAWPPACATMAWGLLLNRGNPISTMARL